jgi:hypothetical protein
MWAAVLFAPILVAVFGANLTLTIRAERRWRAMKVRSGRPFGSHAAARRTR